MSLIARLSLTDPETWPNVETASYQRYWDALALATGSGGHRTGAIYLMGYVAEMLLKTATCRVHNVPADVSIRPSERIAAGATSRTLHYGPHDTQVAWPGGNFHSVESLSRHLIDSRTMLGRGFNTQFATELFVQALTVSANWSETLRYKSVSPNDDELHETYDSVTWFVTNYDRLWS